MSASTKIHNSEAETKIKTKNHSLHQTKMPKKYEAETKIKTKNHSLHQTKMPKKYEDHIETISNKW